jgi:hypothetical protein
MSSKISLRFNNSNFQDFVSKFQDLTNIEDVVKLKIDQDNILMYSMLSNDVSVLALKSYIIKTSEYIEDFNSECTFDFIITNASKYVKNLKFFNSDVPIKLDLTFKKDNEDENIMHVRSSQVSNGKLKISCVGGEQYKIRDLNIKTLEKRMDPKMSKWGFKISKQDFADVKKLCSINNEDKILNINVSKGNVSFNESSKWDIEIDQIEERNEQLIFGKKYLSNINADQDFINFSIFDTFILVKDINSNLMMSFEQSFEDD